jgi:mono/diheme cytochrome c family protein
MKSVWLGVLLMSLVCSGCSDRDADLPAAYRDVPVPEQQVASPAAQAHGRRLFLEHCALCHGEHADGRGLRREGLSRPPQDLTSSAWRHQTSPRHVYFAIREGVRGTPMPSWKALDDRDIWDLVAYVLSLGEHKQ